MLNNHIDDKPVPASPVFPEAYIARGSLVIPYAEIEEPFTAFVDLPKKRSRIDYYGGKLPLFQIKQMESFFFFCYFCQFLPPDLIILEITAIRAINQ